MNKAKNILIVTFILMILFVVYAYIRQPQWLGKKILVKRIHQKWKGQHQECISETDKFEQQSTKVLKEYFETGKGICIETVIV